MASRFRVGDLVWAKMKGFPAWPGKVIEPKPEVKKPSGKKAMQFVFFFGSENYAWVPCETMWNYAQNRDRFTPNKRIPNGFKEAVEAIEEALQAMPTQLKVKTSELPSIDDELAAIFPERPGSASPHRDYTREPLKGKTKPSSTNHKSSSVSDITDDHHDDLASDEGGTPQKRERKPSKKIVESLESEEVASSKPSSVKKKKAKDTFTDKAVKRAIKRASGGSPSARMGTLGNKKPKLTGNKLIVKIPSPKRETSTEEQEEVVEQQPSTSASPTHSMDSLSPTIQALSYTSPKKNIIATPCKIGFLGLGIMGQGMVANLLNSGHEVTVWNRTASKCRDLVKLGALKGETPAEVVQGCDITFSCVSDPTAVKDLVFGNCGVLQGIGLGKGFVDMSTVDVETTTDINEAITMRGGRYLEAPVAGSKKSSSEGDLVILAAGDRTLYEDCFSCFEAMGKRTFYLGNIGNGARMQLVTNMIMGTMTAALAEGMALAEKVGLMQEDLLEVLQLGSLNCPLFRSKGKAMLEGIYEPNFPLQHQQKDLRLALTMGDQAEQPLPVAAAANEMFKRAKARGYSENDMSAVYRAADI